jgi:ribosomal protein L35
MPKIKTHKATAKRFRIKRSKKGVKVLKRAEGQDHFNARENGKTRRNKRTDTTMTRTVQNTILRAMPHA